MTITFHLSQETASSILGLWQLTLHESQAHAFDSTHADDGEASMWAVDLSLDSEEALQSLQVKAKLLAAREAEGVAIGRYLQNFPLTTRHTFAIHDVFPEEDTLRQYLQSQANSRAVSFDNRDNFVQQFKQFMHNIGYLLRPTMQIKSRQGNRPIAQTVVYMNGAFETVWQTSQLASSQTLHQTTVKVTLETRHSIMRFLGQIMAGAVTLATRLSISPIFAMPAALRFAHDVIRRAKQNQLLTHIQQLT